MPLTTAACSAGKYNYVRVNLANGDMVRLCFSFETYSFRHSQAVTTNHIARCARSRRLRSPIQQTYIHAVVLDDEIRYVITFGCVDALQRCGVMLYVLLFENLTAGEETKAVLGIS